MLSFKEYLLLEEKYPSWVKPTVLLLMIKIKKIENLIKNESDVSKKMDLLSNQMKLNSYLTSLEIASEIKDKSLVKIN